MNFVVKCKDLSMRSREFDFKRLPNEFCKHPHLCYVVMLLCCITKALVEFFTNWPVGLMDKASASGAGDSRFESWAGHL